MSVAITQVRRPHLLEHGRLALPFPALVYLVVDEAIEDEAVDRHIAR